MLTYLKEFFTDKATFASAMRALMFLAGELPQVIDFGSAGEPAYWVGKALQVAALAVRSGSVAK